MLAPHFGMVLTHWPLFDLRLSTPRLELRLPTDDEIAACADLAAAGVHDPSSMPFSIPWTELPEPQLQRGVLQWHWRNRADWTADSWRLCLGAFDRQTGEVVGCQDIEATRFPVKRAVATGSWLGRAHQGKGLGKEMRAAVLHLGFAGLGARLARTAAWHDNAASIGVTRAMGYVDDGWEPEVRRDVAERQLRFRLERDDWERHRSIDVTVEDLEPALDLFGLDAHLQPIEGAEPPR